MSHFKRHENHLIIWLWVKKFKVYWNYIQYIHSTINLRKRVLKKKLLISKNSKNNKKWIKHQNEKFCRLLIMHHPSVFESNSVYFLDQSERFPYLILFLFNMSAFVQLVSHVVVVNVEKKRYLFEQWQRSEVWNFARNILIVAGQR